MINDVILSLFAGLLFIIGWFVRQWMKNTASLVDNTEKTLLNLNITLNKLNTNLEVYQATMTESLRGLKEKVSHHDKQLDDASFDLQDHEVRISVLEKTKP